jgi:hypothetical protein
VWRCRRGPRIRIEPDLAPAAAPSFHQPVLVDRRRDASNAARDVDADRGHRRVDPERRDPHTVWAR